jgi:geranylgeranylglycerol-phosphate geranylgeranyltransferase
MSASKSHQENQIRSKKNGRDNSANVSPPYFNIFSGPFLRGYVITMRPYLLFVSGITGAAGLSLSGATSIPRLILYSLIFFLSYGFGQALTDCTQIDTDTISSPYRPLVRGIIRPRDVAIVSLAGLISSGIILALANRTNILLAALAVIGLSTYTFLKRRWWGGPPYNAAIVAILCLIGYETGIGGAGLGTPIIVPLAATILTAFFGYANFVLTGYFKDISADRAAGYNTLPVTYGLKVSVIISDILSGLTVTFSALAIYLVFQYYQPGPESWLFLVPATAGLSMLILGQVRLHRITDENQAYRAIGPVVHSYILLMSAIIMAVRPNWIIPVYYGAFLMVMKYRPEKRQI